MRNRKTSFGRRREIRSSPRFDSLWNIHIASDALVTNFRLESNRSTEFQCQTKRKRPIVDFQRVRPNEQLVVYRLGRAQENPRRPGWTFVFPLVDYARRIKAKQNNLVVPSTQVQHECRHSKENFIDCPSLCLA